MVNNVKKKAHLIDDQGVVTPYIIKAKVEEAPVALSFLEFVTEHNENLHANGQIRYWKQFRDLANKLELFRKKRRMSDILFVDLTVPFLDKFEKFLQQLPNQRDKDSGKVLNRNTVLNNMKRFRTLTRKAVKLGYLSADKDPFLNYEFHWLRCCGMPEIAFCLATIALVFEWEISFNYAGETSKEDVWHTRWARTIKYEIISWFPKPKLFWKAMTMRGNNGMTISFLCSRMISHMLSM